jgi:hypothetical protein
MNSTESNTIEQMILDAATSLGSGASVQPSVAFLQLMVGEMAVNVDSANRCHP